jgi:hypothetical protein
MGIVDLHPHAVVHAQSPLQFAMQLGSGPMLPPGLIGKNPIPIPIPAFAGEFTKLVKAVVSDAQRVGPVAPWLDPHPIAEGPPVPMPVGQPIDPLLSCITKRSTGTCSPARLSDTHAASPLVGPLLPASLPPMMVPPPWPPLPPPMIPPLPELWVPVRDAPGAPNSEPVLPLHPSVNRT